MRRPVRRPLSPQAPRASVRRCAGCPSSAPRPCRPRQRDGLRRPRHGCAARRHKLDRARCRACACAAAARIFASGPTRIGTIRPASAASTAPSNEIASQGWATAVGIGCKPAALREQLRDSDRAGSAQFTPAARCAAARIFSVGAITVGRAGDTSRRPGWCTGNRARRDRFSGRFSVTVTVTVIVSPRPTGRRKRRSCPR